MESDAEQEVNPNAEERIRVLEREKRELRAKIMQDKEAKKREKIEKSRVIEEKAEKDRVQLNKILKAIYLFNKLSKTKRSERNIFQELIDLINQKEVPNGERINTENSEREP